MLNPPARKRTRVLRSLGAIALVLAAGAGMLGSALPATAADDDNTVGVATRPAGADGLPDSRTRFSYTGDPGQSVTDQVLVGNTGSERQEFTVYATDGFNAADGAFSLLETAETPTSIGTWVTFADGGDRVTFSLEPDEVRLLTFTLAFPADATPGDHIGGLVASVVEQGTQVSLDRRVATSIYARVSGELQPSVTVTSMDAAHHGDWWNPFAGSVTVRYSVTNAGNVALAANLTLGVRTWFGIAAASDQGATVPVLLPGNSATYEYEVEGVGQWLYLNPYVRLNPFVDSSDAEAQLLPVALTHRDTVTWAVPWSLLILLALVALALLFVRWRRRQDAARAQAWMEYTEQEATRKAEAQRDADLVDAGKANAP
ncbi:hypothetical protein [Agromyces seonyuensis]|uniref:COG1470 family protein n=1 Tax=Agromyces seonyuensis TaxID=2662446 RepID=UPI00192136B5|nr:hypothetical protein [Agromyces seonyuensis]